MTGVVARHKPSRAAGAPRGASRLGGPHPTGRTFILLVGLAAAISCSGAATGASASPSSGNLAQAQAQAARLSAQAISEAHRVHRLAIAYRADVDREDELAWEVSGSRRALVRLEAGNARTEALLRAEAVFSYADAAPSTGEPLPEGAGFVEASERQTFVNLAVGDLSGTLRQFEWQQVQLSTHMATLRRQLRTSQAVAHSAAMAKDQALREAAAVESLLYEAQDRVDSLKAAAREAAQARQRRAAAGPPVGNGLVKAVAEELGSSAGGAANSSLARTPPATTTTAQPEVRSTVTAAPTTVTSTTTSATMAPPVMLRAAKTTATSTGASTATTTARTTMAKAATTTAALTTTAAPTTTTTAAPTTTTTTSTTVPTTTTVPATTAAATTTVPTTTVPTTTVPTTTVPTTTTTTSTTVPTTTTSPPVTTDPTASAGTQPPPLGGVWLELRECESGDDYQANTGNGFYGAYQFSWSTWNDLGYPGRPDLEPYWMQDQAAERLEASSGWGQWPACSAALGL